jgi:L-alanine-DL-glutamate epimerase-like enolase superfamily enzyme
MTQSTSHLPRNETPARLTIPVSLWEGSHARSATPAIWRSTAVHLPDGPGIGVTLDEDKLRFYGRH